ncbi:MAG: FliM/FliN family flagellar motor switch protein [Puniceicoccales bacterium]|jgi:flagellar motor switch/type III secretory pathway protein FliN|nr:FliM/FliN family flagellar motor switch protein [Puniceicoccales bacterium]
MADEKENLPADDEDLELDELEETESVEEEKDEEWDEEASEEADEGLTEAEDSPPGEGGEGGSGEESVEGQEEGAGGIDGEEGADEAMSPDADGKDSPPAEGGEESGEEGVEGQEEGAGGIDGEEGADEAVSPDADGKDSSAPKGEEISAAVEKGIPAALPAGDGDLKAPKAEAAHVKPAEATEVQIPEAFLHAEYRKGTRASVAQMPIRLTFEVGRQSIRLGDLESLQEGFLFEGGNPMDASVDICANGQLIGKGSLLNIEGRIGVRVTEIF